LIVETDPDRLLATISQRWSPSPESARMLDEA
jgi:hypothetical protein